MDNQFIAYSLSFPASARFQAVIWLRTKTDLLNFMPVDTILCSMDRKNARKFIFLDRISICGYRRGGYLHHLAQSWSDGCGEDHHRNADARRSHVDVPAVLNILCGRDP